MRAERIYTDLISFLTITKCDIDKSVNQHGKAVIKGILKENEDVMAKIADMTWIAIYAEGDNTSKTIFTGIVESMSTQDMNGSTECEIHIVGGTRLMDVEKKTKTFQNAAMTYQEIIATASSEYNAPFMGSEMLQTATNDFFVQYKETDWEFVVRMASNIRASIIPDFSSLQTRYYVGLPESTDVFTCDSVEYIKKKEVNCLRNYAGRMVRNSEVDDVVSFTHREILELGTPIDVENSRYYVYQIHSHWEKEEMVHTYELRRKKDFEVKKLNNFMLVGASMDAEIIDVQAAQVKVQVSVDAEQNVETARWFAYSSVFSSPDGTGWYCMPEIGDKVRVYFPSEEETDAYVISSVHVEEGGGSRSNPDNKSLMNKFDKQVELTPTKITLTNGKGLTFEIDDEEGIKIISNTNITFLAQELVQMVSLNNNVELDALEQVVLSQNGNSIVLDGDVTIHAGQLHIQE